MKFGLQLAANSCRSCNQGVKPEKRSSISMMASSRSMPGRCRHAAMPPESWCAVVIANPFRPTRSTTGVLLPDYSFLLTREPQCRAGVLDTVRWGNRTNAEDHGHHERRRLRKSSSAIDQHILVIDLDLSGGFDQRLNRKR